MTAPTEDEIRAVIEPEFDDNRSLNAAGRLSDAFGQVTGLLDRLYNTEDFRPSEQEALDQAAYDAIESIRQRAALECKDALIAAGLRFAAEHPDAPRAVREPQPV